MKPKGPLMAEFCPLVISDVFQPLSIITLNNMLSIR